MYNCRCIPHVYSKGWTVPKLLTPAAIARLKPDPKRVREIPDAGAHGLRLAVQPTGRMSWIVRGRRPDGRQMKLTLGALDTSSDDGEASPGRSVVTALCSHSRQSAAARAGQGRRHRRAAEEEARVRRQLRPGGDGLRVRPLHGTSRLADHGATPRPALSVRRRSSADPQRARPAMGRQAARRDRRRHGPRHHCRGEGARASPASGPGTDGVSDARGRAMAAAVGKLFSWAARHRRIKINPALGMYRPAIATVALPGPEHERDQGAVGACTELGYPFGDCVRLMLLTGQRRSECAGMRWSELNEDFSAWNLPPARTKNKKPHAVYMPPLARDIIAVGAANGRLRLRVHRRRRPADLRVRPDQAQARPTDEAQ